MDIRDHLKQPDVKAQLAEFCAMIAEVEPAMKERVRRLWERLYPEERVHEKDEPRNEPDERDTR